MRNRIDGRKELEGKEREGRKFNTLKKKEVYEGMGKVYDEVLIFHAPKIKFFQLILQRCITYLSACTSYNSEPGYQKVAGKSGVLID